MKKLILLAAAAVTLATPAFGADLPSRRDAPIDLVSPAFTWSGYYAGVNAGVDWSSRNIETIVSASQSSILTSATDLTPAPYGNSRTGFIGGIQMGYNYQINQFVIGAEVDLMGMVVSKRSVLPVSNIEADVPIIGGFIIPLTVGLNGSTKVSQDWLGTLRLRAGYGIDRILIYGTGGLAFGNADLSAQASATASVVGLPIFSGNWNGNKNSTSVGFAVGAGVEYAITNNWTMRVEYLYYNLGAASVVTNGISALILSPAGPSPIAVSQKTTIDGNIVRFAINYKL